MLTNLRIKIKSSNPVKKDKGKKTLWQKWRLALVGLLVAWTQWRNIWARGHHNRNLKNWKQREQRLRKHSRISQDFIAKGVMYVLGVSYGEEREEGTEETFERIMTDNFPQINVGCKATDPEAQKTWSRLNANSPPQNTPRNKTQQHLGILFSSHRKSK